MAWCGVARPMCPRLWRLATSARQSRVAQGRRRYHTRRWRCRSGARRWAACPPATLRRRQQGARLSSGVDGADPVVSLQRSPATEWLATRRWVCAPNRWGWPGLQRARWTQSMRLPVPWHAGVAACVASCPAPPRCWASDPCPSLRLQRPSSSCQRHSSLPLPPRPHALVLVPAARRLTWAPQR